MPEPYPIIDVLAGHKTTEDMGGKTKFWFHHPETDSRWLFKYPRSNTGEHWAEKITAEVAERLGYPHARVELAQFGRRRGSASQSFARECRELVHGNQILVLFIRGYDAQITEVVGFI